MHRNRHSHRVGDMSCIKQPRLQWTEQNKSFQTNAEAISSRSLVAVEALMQLSWQWPSFRVQMKMKKKPPLYKCSFPIAMALRWIQKVNLWNSDMRAAKLLVPSDFDPFVSFGDKTPPSNKKLRHCFSQLKALCITDDFYLIKAFWLVFWVVIFWGQAILKCPVWINELARTAPRNFFHQEKGTDNCPKSLHQCAFLLSSFDKFHCSRSKINGKKAATLHFCVRKLDDWSCEKMNDDGNGWISC